MPSSEYHAMNANSRTANLDAETIGQLTKDDCLKFFSRYISPLAPQRAKLSVHLVADSRGATAVEKPSVILGHAHMSKPQAASVLRECRKATAHEGSPFNDFCEARRTSYLQMLTGLDVRECSDPIAKDDCSPMMISDYHA